MTKAAWLIVGAGVALAGVAAFLWGSGSGTPREMSRVDPRTGTARSVPGSEGEELTRASVPATELSGAGPGAADVVRTEVEGANSSAGGVFEFRVVERGTKKPVAGAEITYLWKDLESEEDVPWDLDQLPDFELIARRTLADGGGYVSVPFRLGKLYVVAEKANFFGRDTFHVEEETPSGLEDLLEVAADWSLTVQVLDYADQPASGVPVALGHKTGRWSGASFTAETDAGGKHRYEHVGYRMATRNEGTWSVRLDLLLLEPVQRELDVEEDVGETVVLRMPPVGALEVVVTEADGSPAPDGTVVYAGIVEEDQPRDISPFSNHEREYVRVETTDGAALYPFVELRQEFEVKVSHEGDRITTREYGDGPGVAGERREFSVMLGLENPVLVFRAVSEARAPLAEQDLTLEMAFRSNFMSNSWNREVKTDSEGLFRVDIGSHYEEGDLRFLTVSDGQEAPRMAQIDLAREFTPGQHDMGDLVLGDSPVLVAGRVTDAIGAPLAGAEVSLQTKLVREDEDVSWDRMKVKAVTDEAGDFELRGVTPGTELYVSASVEGKRGESVVARVGDMGVRLVLYGTGGLSGSVLLDEEVPDIKIVVKATRNDATPLPENMYGRSEDQEHPDTNGAFYIDNLIPGTYTVEVELQQGQTTLVTIEGVTVADGKPTRDPRLASIDLRGRLFVHRLVLVTPKPVENLQGTLQLRQAGDTEGQQQWQWFNESPVDIVCEHEAIDIELSVRGFRGVELEDVRGEREIQLDDGLPIRLILRTDGEVPAPPYYVKAVLIPVEGGHNSIDWGAPCFDEAREVRTRAYGTGQMKVQWLVEKRGSTGSAMATTANVEPEQFVEVLETPAEQTFEVEISAEQLGAITKDL